jgi:Flp pilus assembly protein CpaB
MSERRFQSRGQVNVVVQMIVFISAIGLLAFLAYRQIDRVLNPERSVVVLTEAVKAGEAVKPEQVGIASFRSSNLPANVLDDPEELVGRTLVRGKQAGVPLYPSDLYPLAVRSGPALSTLVPADRVVTTLALTNLTVPHNSLKAGDRIDVLVAGTGPDRKRTSVVAAREAMVLGYLTPPKNRAEPRKGLLGLVTSGAEREKKIPPGLMLAVLPKEVPALAEVQGTNAAITIALHSRKSVDEGKMLTVGRVPVPKTVDVITGATRESIHVHP